VRGAGKLVRDLHHEFRKHRVDLARHHRRTRLEWRQADFADSPDRARGEQPEVGSHPSDDTTRASHGIRHTREGLERRERGEEVIRAAHVEPALVAEVTNGELLEALRCAESRSHGRPPEGHDEHSGRRSFEILNGLLDGMSLRAMERGHRHRHRVLQTRATQVLEAVMGSGQLEKLLAQAPEARARGRGRHVDG
jgi:hypothetical protein